MQSLAEWKFGSGNVGDKKKEQRVNLEPPRPMAARLNSISREQQIGRRIEVDNHCTRLSLEEHTGTFLLSGKYFLYVCCSLAKAVSFYICYPAWFCLVLSNSARFMPSGTMGFNANVQAIPFFRPDVPKSNHFLLYMLKLYNFLFLTTVCGVHSCIELHGKKIRI